MPLGGLNLRTHIKEGYVGQLIVLCHGRHSVAVERSQWAESSRGESWKESTARLLAGFQCLVPLPRQGVERSYNQKQMNSAGFEGQIVQFWTWWVFGTCETAVWVHEVGRQESMVRIQFSCMEGREILYSLQYINSIFGTTVVESILCWCPMSFISGIMW